MIFSSIIILIKHEILLVEDLYRFIRNPSNRMRKMSFGESWDFYKASFLWWRCLWWLMWDDGGKDWEEVWCQYCSDNVENEDNGLGAAHNQLHWDCSVWDRSARAGVLCAGAGAPVLSPLLPAHSTQHRGGQQQQWCFIRGTATVVCRPDEESSI